MFDPWESDVGVTTNLTKHPPAEAGPSNRVYLKQSDFDAYGLTHRCPLGAEQCEKAYEHNVTQRYAAQERENCFKKQRRANDWKRLNATHDTAGGAVKRIKLQFDDRPADPASSSSGSPSDATAGSDAASFGNVVAGGVPRDAAQDTVVSGGADGPREGHPGKEPAKRQRTEKTELEMEASNVAKIKDSRRILEQRRNGWALENINHRDAAMLCTGELQRKVIVTHCTKRAQLDSTWDLCRAQGAQRLGYVCEFVGNVADDPMTKNIQNSTGHP